jgi:hypothetical protein
MMVIVLDVLDIELEASLARMAMRLIESLRCLVLSYKFLYVVYRLNDQCKVDGLDRYETIDPFYYSTK